MNILTLEHPTQPGLMVEAVTVHTADQLREVRDSDWHDGQLAICTYPTALPVGYIAPDNPKALAGSLRSREDTAFGRVTRIVEGAVMGVMVRVGDTILKGPGGDFEVIPEAEWSA